MVTKCNCSDSGKIKNDALPQEVTEAIAEIGGLDRILNAIKPDEVDREVKLHRILI